jgi:hypothetical protein
VKALQNLHIAQSQISDIRLLTEKRFGDPVSEYGMTFDRVLQSPRSVNLFNIIFTLPFTFQTAILFAAA